ncbi:hypothetical protein JCM10295v2_000227 [Rhodotorula toruloides]
MTGEAPPSLGSAGLPETADFRTSLILPNLMKRFSLLRGEDGQLVDLVTMQHHLAAQRQTGRLTAYEVDAVLAQYRLQSAAEQSRSHLPPPAASSSGYTKRKRMDWSKIDLEQLTGSSADGGSSAASGNDPARSTTAATASTSTATTTPHTSLVPPPPRSPASSSIHSFSSPSSPSQTSPLASPPMSRDSSSGSTTAYPYQYRRGANSLFGARASGEEKRSVSAGMARGRSRESTASGGGSVKGKEREREESASLRTEEGEGEREADETLLVQSDPLASDSTYPTSLIPSLQINPSTPTDPSFPPPLSPQQLRRISRALDDIEAELGRTYEKLKESDYATSEEEREREGEALEEERHEEDERADRTDLHHLDVSLDGLSPVSPLEGVPASPTSPITAADLAGLTTFNTSAQADDTEPVDPFYQRSSPVPVPPTRAPPSPPRPSHEILRDSQRDSVAASLSHSSSLDRLASSTPLALGTRTTSPTPTPSLSSIVVPNRASRVRALSLDTDDDPAGGRTPSTAAGDEEDESEELSSRAQRFPVVERTDSEQTERAEAKRVGPGGAGAMVEGEDFLEVPPSHAGDEGEGEKTVSDSGPFDLSVGDGTAPAESDSRRGSRRRSRMPGAFVRDPAERNSTATLDSVGSSFHGSAAEHRSDDDVFPPTSIAAPGSPASPVPTSYAPALTRPHSLATNVVVTSSPDLAKSIGANGSPSLLRPTSFPLDRRPSNELLQTTSEASRKGEDGTEPGDTSDLILQDLLLIQEKLVQSAARRAARSASSPNSALATPSSVASPAEEQLLASPLVARSALASEPQSLETSPKGATTAPRKASVDSSGDATDLGGQLAGLGLSSLMPFDLGEVPDSPPQPRVSTNMQRRGTGRRRSEDAGRRQSEAVGEADEEDDERDSTFLGPASTHMTVQTSQTSSTSPFTNSVITPSSTEHSDVFEFSSLVGSPESAAWEDAQEHIKPDSFASGSIRTEASPRVGLPDSPDPSTSYSEDAKDTPEGSARVEPPSASTSQSSSLAGPAPIDTESFLRVPRPRNKPMRDPASTPSMLIRDVRNQATLATIALKKQNPASPPSRPLNKSRSIRKGSISSPQLVSGPVDIPAVPILSPQLGAQSPGRSAPKPGKKSRKDDDEGRKSKGLGSRFKMLLKKPTVRDQLGQLNGDEVTPFVTANPDNAPRTRTSAIPVTPPNQSLARFGSPGFDSPDTVRTAQRDTLPADATAPACAAVNESADATTRSPSLASSSPQIDSPPRSGDSHGSGQSRSLSRLMSRMRSNTGGADEKAPTSPKQDVNEASGPAADESPHAAPSSKFLEGLGFGDDVVQSSRTPAQYAVGSPRSRHKAEFETVNGTPIAPLSFTRRPAGDEAESTEPSPSTPSFVASPPSRASIDSMRKLWQAAEDLGLPRDKVQEFVESAYARSPTTASSHAHTGSTDSTAGRFSAFGSSSGSQRRPSEVPTSADEHWRRPSDFSGRVPSEGLDGPGSADSNMLVVPHSPSLGSIVSRRSSEYASSFLDYYANDDEASPLPRSDSASFRGHGRLPSLAPSVDELLAQQQEQEHTARLQPVAEFDEHPDHGNAERGAEPSSPTRFENDGEVVWQVLDDLRNNRLSVLSKNSSISFGSRDSSFAFDKQSSDGDQPNSIANLLRHRDRKRSSASMPAEWDGRYPSIYFREEQALMNLAEQGGVAPELEGRFLVRAKDQQPEVPPLPEQYRMAAQADPSLSQESEAPSAM